METATIPFWSYWYFHIPNYVLAALLYTLIGRFTLSLFVPPNWPNYIWRTFCLLTEWPVRASRYLVPMIVPYGVLPLVAAFWVVILRTVFSIVMVTAGYAPQLQPVSP